MESYATITIATLSILSLVITALIWLLKKLFTQNDTTIKQNTMVNAALSKSIDNLNDTMQKNEDNRLEFQTNVIDTLKGISTGQKKISEVQDAISCRQVNMYDHINTNMMNVENMTVKHETVDKVTTTTNQGV